MSELGFLDKLLDGAEVEWLPLGDLEDSGLVKLGRGNVISKNDLANVPGDFPVYSSSASSQGEFGRYGKFMFDDERLTWSIDGGGRFFYRKPHRYSVTNVCGWMRVLQPEKLSTRYLYHYLSAAWATKVFDYTKKAHPSVIRKEYSIPIPCPEEPEKSLAIQGEIVRILDSFTELTAELTAELAARKRQYNYYRESLFTFTPDEANFFALGDERLGEFIRGGGLQKKDFTGHGVGCIHYGQIYTHYGTYAHSTKSFVSQEFAKKSRKAKKGDLVIATTSENDDDVCKAVAWLGDEDIAVSSDACFYSHNLNPKYVAYFFQTEQFQKQKRAFITGTKVRRVNADSLAKIIIPVPRNEDEQERIVAILDKFDTLTTSLSEGLPREIALRQQQYEFYRDLLLSFPQPAEAVEA